MSTSFKYYNNFIKDIKRISNKLKKIDIKTIDKDHLILYSQNYLDFIIRFLGMEKNDMDYLAIITKDMVYNPVIFNDFLNFYREKYDINETIEELKKIPSHCYVAFYHPKGERGFVYIEKNSHLVSELAHFALHQVGYYKDKVEDQLVSELFDGTMVINFEKVSHLFKDELNEIQRRNGVYNCLPKDIKNYIREISMYGDKYDNKYVFLETKFKKTCMNKIEDIKKDLNKIQITIPCSKEKPEWHYIVEEVLNCHMQASYILTQYKEKYGMEDPFYRKLWLRILKCETLTYSSISTLLESEFDISL